MAQLHERLGPGPGRRLIPRQPAQRDAAAALARARGRQPDPDQRTGHRCLPGRAPERRAGRGQPGPAAGSRPRGADDAAVERLRQRAEELAQRAPGADFAALVREFSDAADKTRGGELGMRGVDRYPALFLDATRSLQPARSPRSCAAVPASTCSSWSTSATPACPRPATRRRGHATSCCARSAIEPEAAIARLQELRQRIAAGSARFDEVARQISQDGSASAGGDLGWANPACSCPSSSSP